MTALPCEQDDDQPDIACLTCGDDPDGVQVGEFGIPLPCPDCGLSDLWTNWHEAWDEARRGR